MSDDDPFSITARLERAVYDTGQQPLINQRHSKDIKAVRFDVDQIGPRVRALEVSEQLRFTKKQAEELFNELFAADIKERQALARLVRMIYVPLGLLAVGVLLDGIRGLIK